MGIEAKTKTDGKKIFYGAFGMIESVIAIFIVGTILVTFVSVLGAMFRTESNQMDYIIATNLAQEGIEAVRNLRDNNLKNMCPSDGTKPCSAFEVDANGGIFPSLESCNNWSDDCALSNMPELPDPDGKFIRDVLIQTGVVDGSRNVTARVKWTPRGSTTETQIDLTDTLYPWGQNE